MHTLLCGVSEGKTECSRRIILSEGVGNIPINLPPYGEKNAGYLLLTLAYKCKCNISRKLELCVKKQSFPLHVQVS